MYDYGSRSAQIVCSTGSGPLVIAAVKEMICAVRFESDGDVGRNPGCHNSDLPVLREACRQIQEYFAGSRRVFDLPVQLAGTAFQQSVWREIATIPFGATVTYGELAGRIGSPRSARAVGQALRRNPVPIIIPCHRVVGSAGGLGGFTPDIAIKKWLLMHEGVAVKN